MVIVSGYSLHIMGPEEAGDSKEARRVAFKRLGAQISDRRLKVSSVIANRGRGGWTINFKEAS